KQVLFKISMSPKPGDPPKEMALVMSEGERQGEVEVLEIDEPGGVIKFNNHGQEQTLTLEKDGEKPPPGSPLPSLTQPGVPSAMAVPNIPRPQPLAPGVNPQPAIPNPATTPDAGAGGLSRIPSRMLRVPPATGTAVQGTDKTALPPLPPAPK